ncbi:lipoate--protein ligase [Thioalkalivibrio denitrificans]|uniref:Lipoate--protein ligase n=1 Tax=Thioalkalivibrio denitrificans TaxID=108003 RepID=A0A1V3NCA3_9GAMM|nr:biotin/lipoate A/B protein ligase family protein [Thioalkalivibrio denitrificans]OOG22482.1 lipoate--protein ligase [Thioalkalivibrio denitrificans]
MRDAKTLRVLDTGLRRAAENMALNRALLESHQAGTSPHTLRFLRFTPSALLGFHQDVEQELRTDYCAEQGIDIQRRITGGGAIYFDETQIGWELYLDKGFLGTADMGAIAKKICEAAAEGISALGVDARYRPRNDIEVDGRKISGTGGAFDGDSIMYQGTLLIDFDVERMLRVLRIPAEKLSDKAIESARDRVANLKDLLGGNMPTFAEVQERLAESFARAFDVKLEWADAMNAAEDAAFREALADIDTPEWTYQHNRPATDATMHEAITRSQGGTLRVGVAVDPVRNQLKQVWITGDFFVKPRRLVVDLEGALRNTPIEALEANVKAFFEDHPAEMLMLTPDDFVSAIRAAVDAGRD